MEDMHTLKSFEDALSDIVMKFRNMGELVIDCSVKASKCFLEGDSDLALVVVSQDLDVDVAFENLRAHCFKTLLRFQPAATDLRLVMAIEHSAGDLERAGDHAKNIARRVISHPTGVLQNEYREQLKNLGAGISETLQSAVTAMVDRSPQQAHNVIAADRRIDALNDAIFDSVMVKLQKSVKNAPAMVQAMFVAKSLERIGDHATNIAEEVLFVTRGLAPAATRDKGG